MNHQSPTERSSSSRFLKAHPSTIVLFVASCILVGFNFWYAGFGLRERKSVLDLKSKEISEQVRRQAEREIEYLEAKKRKQAEINRTTHQTHTHQSSKSSLPTENSDPRFAVDPGSKNPGFNFQVPDKSRKTSECDVCSAKACTAVRATSLHRTCCNTTGKSVWPLLVTGTPRSGTVAVTNLLTALKLDVKTDWSKPGDHGHISWIHLFNEQHDIQANRSKYPVPHYGRGYAHTGRRYWSGVHLVRNPLKSITSIACTEPWFQTQWWFFVTAHVRIDPSLLLSLNHFGVAMAFYLAWHRAADATCMYRLRLEDAFNPRTSPEVLGDLFNLAGLGPPTPEQVKAAIASVGHESNAREHRPTVTWEELFAVDKRMAKDVLDLSRKYGYPYDDADEAMLHGIPPATHSTLPDCQLDKYDSDWGGGGYLLPTLTWD